MTKGRLEAFSDGVIAIVITIMVLEIRVPQGTDWEALLPLAPVMLAYVLSFVFVGIYWNNHHHLLQAARQVNGKILWANLHLLFWLTLIPVVTHWFGEHPAAPLPVALYGVDLLMAGVAYWLLARALVAHHGRDSTLAKALGTDFKGNASVAMYAVAVPLAYASTWLSIGIYVLVAIMWVIPDRRFENVFL